MCKDLARQQLQEAIDRFRADPTLQNLLAMDAYALQLVKEAEAALYERQVREMRGPHELLMEWQGHMIKVKVE